MDIQINPTPLETAQIFLARITAGDIAGMEATMTDDFSCRFLPQSLGIPARTKPQYLTLMKSLNLNCASLKLHQPEDVVQTADAVVMHLMCEGETAKGAPFHGEYVMTFRCEGAKVRDMTEFSDSKCMDALFEAVDGYKLLRKVGNTTSLPASKPFKRFEGLFEGL
ncbi:hypothetical protein C8J57DRAFT_177997 [Mycena rebaudengoi]|nr:hypothetical protein C8J57DRAFT_181526 [Mycena rebaudengoi]KAJ7231935.1 hypothetical protein C8J57DRAFT_177997 [Mycena rebaudengoi]